jgi:hypothetical protein
LDAKVEHESALEKVNNIKLFDGENQPPDPVYTVSVTPIELVAVKYNVSEIFEKVINSPLEGIGKPMEGASDCKVPKGFLYRKVPTLDAQVKVPVAAYGAGNGPVAVTLLKDKTEVVWFAPTKVLKV